MISAAQLFVALFYDHIDENKTVFTEHIKTIHTVHSPTDARLLKL